MGLLSEMKALIALPHGCLRRKLGGATVQAVKTAKYLSRLGVSVNIIDEHPSTDLLSKYDVIHTFGHIGAYIPSTRAKSIPRKLVFTPIYWPEEKMKKAFWETLAYGTSRLLEVFYDQIRRPSFMAFYFAWTFSAQWLPLLSKAFQKIWLHSFKIADILVVNSVAERDIILKLINKEIDAKVRVVYNGVDEEVYGKPISWRIQELFYKRFKIRDYVLNVGRLEPGKNQLMLVRACKKLNMPCVLVGRIYNRYYAKKVLRELGSMKNGSLYLGRLQPDSNLLISAYINSKIVAVPSLLETPGLVALEAASLGRTVVVTRVGSTLEYFEDNAYYVDPFNQSSLEEALLDAWNNPINEEHLRKFILGRYTWSKAAKHLYQIYLETMAS